MLGFRLLGNTGRVQACSAYRRGRSTVLIASVRSGATDCAAPPCVVLDADATAELLGAACRSVTGAYRVLEVPASRDVVQRWEQEVLRTVGVARWNTLERNAKLVEIELNEHGWRIAPMRRLAGGRGWTEAETERTRARLLSADADDETLGQALTEALAGPLPTS